MYGPFLDMSYFEGLGFIPPSHIHTHRHTQAHTDTHIHTRTHFGWNANSQTLDLPLLRVLCTAVHATLLDCFHHQLQDAGHAYMCTLCGPYGYGEIPVSCSISEKKNHEHSLYYYNGRSYTHSIDTHQFYTSLS